MSTYAAITGWGKCLPPAVLSNQDLAGMLETSDEWITSRTGIRERRVSHVPMAELAHVAAEPGERAAGHSDTPPSASSASTTTPPATSRKTACTIAAGMPRGAGGATR